MREIVLDTETTGLDPLNGHRIIEIGCVEIVNKMKTGKVFHRYINPDRDVPIEAFNIHGISTEFLLDKPKFEEVCEEFLEFIGEDHLVIHNARFDIKFINHELKQVNREHILMSRVVDTLAMARKNFPGSPATLDALCKRFGVSLESRTKHGALLDSELLYEVYFELCGGSQRELSFKAAKKANFVDYQENILVDKRSFLPTPEEESSHKELITKLKRPIWEQVY